VPVHGLDGDQDAAAEIQAQHVAARTTETSRVTVSRAALVGTRTTIPESSTTSAIAPATTRRGTNGEGDGAFDSHGFRGDVARIGTSVDLDRADAVEANSEVVDDGQARTAVLRSQMEMVPGQQRLQTGYAIRSRDLNVDWRQPLVRFFGVEFRERLSASYFVGLRLHIGSPRNSHKTNAGIVQIMVLWIEFARAEVKNGFDTAMLVPSDGGIDE
jgi:hypothetical protein